MNPRLGWLLALGAVACGRAQAEDLPLAKPGPVEAARSSTPLPAPAPVRAPAAARDRDLLPCPGQRPSCESEHPVVARGVLARAEVYLAKCRDCRDRALVAATARRMQPIVARDERRRRRDESDDCRSALDMAILVSPDSVVAGDRPRVIVASDRTREATLEVTSEHGAPVGTKRPPPTGAWQYQVVELDAVQRGDYRVRVREGERVVACRRFSVSAERRRRVAGETPWKSPRGWDRGSENLYSAWIAAAFDASEGTRWKGIGAVLTDPARNFLHDHLGLGEDATPERLALRPDCADAPYVLRAYFAWKLGLPFGRHRCSSDELDGPPRCRSWTTNESPLVPAPPTRERASPGQFRDFAEQLLEDVTARSLRTALADPATDLYPVALEREHLRPGVVFADPHGHTLTLVKWVPQGPGRPGQLLAVDAQPDGTLGIRRFWRGNFLFVDQPAARGFGFKAFRPIVRAEGELRLLDNAELGVADGYGGFSLEQAQLDAAGFYAHMSRLISPNPTPPAVELFDLVDAFLAQLERRVAEVAIADEIVAGRKSAIEMPEGRAMFQATGPWEAVSTPCRDLRLLVGVDALLAFPEQAARGEPDAGRAAALRRELEALLGQRTASRSIEYVRSDGTSQRLTLAEIIARRARFEMAYNPNDCPELRWGAAEGSPELATCGRRAPAAQRNQMERMRHWFVKRYSCG